MENDKNLAEEYFKSVSEEYFALGVGYIYGEFGYPKDLSKGFESLVKAAELGHVKANLLVGICYEFGNGVEKNITAAVKHYIYAAEHGDSNAQANLGGCYFRGEGINKDIEAAEYWWNKSAQAGNMSAQNALKTLYKEKEKQSNANNLSGFNLNQTIRFTSNNHIRYNDGIRSTNNNFGAHRGILILPSGNQTFQVSIHVLNSDYSDWGEWIQMEPKQMKLEKKDEIKRTITMRGFGYDIFGEPFSDYGITIHLDQNSKISKIDLNMFDRNVVIEYLAN